MSFNYLHLLDFFNFSLFFVLFVLFMLCDLPTILSFCRLWDRFSICLVDSLLYILFVLLFFSSSMITPTIPSTAFVLNFMVRFFLFSFFPMWFLDFMSFRRLSGPFIDVFIFFFDKSTLFLSMMSSVFLDGFGWCKSPIVKIPLGNGCLQMKIGVVAFFDPVISDANENFGFILFLEVSRKHEHNVSSFFGLLAHLLHLFLQILLILGEDVQPNLFNFFFFEVVELTQFLLQLLLWGNIAFHGLNLYVPWRRFIFCGILSEILPWRRFLRAQFLRTIGVSEVYPFWVIDELL